jgi:hypothetical protein
MLAGRPSPFPCGPIVSETERPRAKVTGKSAVHCLSSQREGVVFIPDQSLEFGQDLGEIGIFGHFHAAIH